MNIGVRFRFCRVNKRRSVIVPDGTATIRKYNHEIRRAINNDVWLDDVLQDN